MAAERTPVEGFTVERSSPGRYTVRYPNGDFIHSDGAFTAKDLEIRHIPVPPKPWVDPTGLGLTEVERDWLLGLPDDDPAILNHCGTTLKKLADKLREEL